MVALAFSPTQHSGNRGRGISEFKATLLYKSSSRTGRASQRNPIWKTSNQNLSEIKGWFLCIGWVTVDRANS